MPDDSPYTTGGIGLLGTAPSQEAMEECDTLFIVGSSLPVHRIPAQARQARGVQIDIDPTRIGLRYPVEVGLVGDCQRVLQALLPLLAPQGGPRLPGEGAGGHGRMEGADGERGTRTDKPMKPQVVACELGKRLARRRDRRLRLRHDDNLGGAVHPHARGQLFSLSGMLATMANGLPYAMAAQIAYPERQCVAFVGDGGFSMLMGEFATAVKYKLPVKVVVIKNNTLGQIKWEQMVFWATRSTACELQPIDFASLRARVRRDGFTIDDPADIAAEMLGCDTRRAGPVVRSRGGSV